MDVSYIMDSGQNSHNDPADLSNIEKKNVFFEKIPYFWIENVQ